MDSKRASESLTGESFAGEPNLNNYSLTYWDIQFPRFNLPFSQKLFAELIVSVKKISKNQHLLYSLSSVCGKLTTFSAGNV